MGQRRSPARVVGALVFVIALIALVVVARMVTNGTPDSVGSPSTVPASTRPAASAPTDASATVRPPASAPASKHAPATTAANSDSDAQLRHLFETKQSDVQVTGAGTVSRLMADDTQGDRHQRFILRLASGQTLLVAHNIDIAPRLNGLAVGDPVAFSGSYIYTAQGGTIHWTHHDPGGTHAAGWLEWNGKKYS